MRSLFVGAGATGGYFGARLLAAGRDVTFLVRPRRAQILAAEGLHVQSPHHGDVHIDHPPTTTAPQIHHAFDLIFLSPKAYDLPQAMEDLAPAVGPGTLILPVLNGMAHLNALDARFGRPHVLGGFSNISSTLTPENKIQHLAPPHRLGFGHRDEPHGSAVLKVAEALTGAGFDAYLSPGIEHDMWIKWVSIATNAGITCLLRAAVGDIIEAGASPLAQALQAECVSVAAAEGFSPRPHDLDHQNGILNRPGSLFTASMLRDLEAGAPVERQAILGDLLARAQAHQLPTPVLAMADAHMRCYEARRARERAGS